MRPLLTAVWLLVTVRDTSLAQTIIPDCPTYCTCSYFDYVLTITCTGPQLNYFFYLPDVTQYPILQQTLSLVIKNSYLRVAPTNLCTLASSLTIIDLSSNLIGQTIGPSTFNCLTKLQFLTLKNNSLQSISETAFDNLINLKYLDLSHNQLTTIPNMLFFRKLPNLNTLILCYNMIYQLDFWFLFLENLTYLDLSYNWISRFANGINWNPRYISTYTSLQSAELFDLRNNNLTNVNDQMLQLYSICDSALFAYFVRLLNRMQLDSNPISCSCQNSYNTLKFYSQFIAANPTSTSYKLFTSSVCANQAVSAFAFTNASTCAATATPFTAYNCGNTNYTTTTSTTTTSTTTTTYNLANNVLNTPQLLVGGDDEVTGTTYLEYKMTSATVAGIVIALIGFLLIFMILVYCICPIEVLAIMFDCVPCFYRCCPCKSGAKRDKDFDLFISYNKANENWIVNNLVPFIKANHLAESYVLHYDKSNKAKEAYGPYIKDVMSRSSCILFVLSDQFLMNEWNNRAFREHLKHLITKEKTRFVSVQMHDVCDEEVEEYFRQKLQMPMFVSLENDEFLFWKKLEYFLFANEPDAEKITPVEKPKPPKRSVLKKLEPLTFPKTDGASAYNFYKAPINSNHKYEPQTIDSTTTNNHYLLLNDTPTNKAKSKSLRRGRNISSADVVEDNIYEYDNPAYQSTGSNTRLQPLIQYTQHQQQQLQQADYNEKRQVLKLKVHVDKVRDPKKPPRDRHSRDKSSNESLRIKSISYEPEAITRMGRSGSSHSTTRQQPFAYPTTNPTTPTNIEPVVYHYDAIRRNSTDSTNTNRHINLNNINTTIQNNRTTYEFEANTQPQPRQYSSGSAPMQPYTQSR